MRDALRRFLLMPRLAAPPQRPVREALLVALVAALSVAGVLNIDAFDGWRPAALTLALIFPLPLLWRWTRPVATVATMVAAAVGAATVGVAFGHPWVLHSEFTLGTAVAVFALARRASGREILAASPAVLGLVAAGVAADVAVTVGPLSGVAEWDWLALSALVASAVASWSFPAALGLVLRSKAEAQAEVQASRVADARQAERLHLARELHDSVAHHVSAIAVQAQAARVVMAAQPESAAEAAAEALAVVEAQATLALAEMRAVVGAFREAPPVTATVGLADLERMETAGPPAVEVSFSGALAHLPPAVEASLFRLAQESVTNARRHAQHATRVSVRVEGADGRVRLVVADDGTSGGRRGAGYGLVGMAERASLLGGHLAAGPADGGGWRVEAELPTTGDAPLRP